MSRSIYCEKCGELQPMHAEDVAMGFHRRRVEIMAKKPAELERKTYEGKSMADLRLVKVETLPSLLCDGCGCKIDDGTKAIAVTMWRGDEPARWEDQYQ